MFYRRAGGGTPKPRMDLSLLGVELAKGSLVSLGFVQAGGAASVQGCAAVRGCTLPSYGPLSLGCSVFSGLA